LYVSDRSNNQVILIDPNLGKPIYRFGQNNINIVNQCHQLYRPTGLVVDDANKRLLICDKDNHRICFYTMDGQYISSFGKRGLCIHT
jgi:tripartite motif-containing protein 71